MAPSSVPVRAAARNARASATPRCERRALFRATMKTPVARCAQRCSTRASVIASTEGVFAVLTGAAAIGQHLEDNSKLGARVSAPILAMATTSALSTAGLLPTASIAYDVVWDHLMPMGVVLALLSSSRVASSRDKIDKDTGWQVLRGFIVGAFGTIVGTYLSFACIGRALGAEGWKIASCLCSSYIGGSINFAATAKALDIVNSGGQALLTAGMAADNLAMAVYLGILFLIKTDGPKPVENANIDQVETSRQIPTKSSLCATCAVALIVLRLSYSLAAAVGVPSFNLGITCILAPCVAWAMRKVSQMDNVRLWNLCSITEMPGAQEISGALMLVFFATLGAMVDLRSGALASLPILAFIGMLLVTQLVFTLLVGHKLLKIPLWAVLVATNANVGGPATAAALASARGWHRATSPAVMTGIFGYSVATLIGMCVGKTLVSLG